MKKQIVEARDHARAAFRALAGRTKQAVELAGVWSHYPEFGTKLGMHAQKSTPELFGHIERARDAGAPMVAVKALDDLNILRAVKERRPETLTIGRIVDKGAEGVEGIELVEPGDVAAIDAYARRLLAPALEFYSHNPDMAEFVDVLEIANEPDPPALGIEVAQWVAAGGNSWEAPALRGYNNLGSVFMAAIRIGRELMPGLSWGVGSFNAGTPEYGEMQAFISSGILDLAAERHDVMLMVHAGALGNDPIDKGYGEIIPGAPSVPAGAGQMVGRSAYFAAIAGDKMLPTVVSEGYYGGGYDDTPDIVDRATWMDTWAAARPWIVAVLPFTHSPYQGWENQNYTPHYDALIDQVAVPATGRKNAAPGGVQPPPSGGPGDPPRVDYARTYVLLNPDAGEAWAVAASVAAYMDQVAPIVAPRWTIGGSADDAGAGETSRRRCIAVNPAGWGAGDDGQGLKGFFANYYPNCVYQELLADNPSDMARKLQIVITGGEPDPEPVYRPVKFDAWGTEYKVVTQPFGANPDNYLPFGLPGHEGIDKRAPHGSRIFACVAGTVIKVGDDQLPASQGGHNYGTRVYIESHLGTGDNGLIIRHTLVYAHLLERRVGVGDVVRAGQLIGLADSTGNANGSHLHLTVYQAGAQWPGYPAGIIDPMIGLAHLLAPPPPVAGVAVGLHASADPAFSAGDIDKFVASGSSAVKLLSFHDPAAVAELASRMPGGTTYIIRAFLSFVENGQPRRVTPREFVSWTAGDVQRTIEAIQSAGKLHTLKIELHNEPNLAAEGLGGSWHTPAQFGEWLNQVALEYSELFTAPLLYPGLSPGGTIPGVKHDSTAFMAGSFPMVDNALYGICVHNYWAANYPMERALDQLRDIAGRYPGRRFFITEASNNKGDTLPAAKAAQYRLYPSQAAQALPGLEAITYYLASASDPKWGWDVLGASGEVITAEMAAIMGAA